MSQKPSTGQCKNCKHLTSSHWTTPELLGTCKIVFCPCIGFEPVLLRHNETPIVNNPSTEADELREKVTSHFLSYNSEYGRPELYVDAVIKLFNRQQVALLKGLLEQKHTAGVIQKGSALRLDIDWIKASVITEALARLEGE